MLSSLRRKLLWLLAARAAVVTVLLGSGALMQSSAPDALAGDTNAFFAVIGVTYALTVAYALLLNQTERRRWLVDVQLAIDTVIVSTIVYLTGGINSYFSSLYTLPIIAATTIESRRGGVMVGILSCVLYAGIVVAQYAGVPGFEAHTGTPLPDTPAITPCRTQRLSPRASSGRGASFGARASDQMIASATRSTASYASDEKMAGQTSGRGTDGAT